MADRKQFAYRPSLNLNSSSDSSSDGYDKVVRRFGPSASRVAGKAAPNTEGAGIGDKQKSPVRRPATSNTDEQTPQSAPINKGGGGTTGNGNAAFFAALAAADSPTTSEASPEHRGSSFNNSMSPPLLPGIDNISPKISVARRISSPKQRSPPHVEEIQRDSGLVSVSNLDALQGQTQHQPKPSSAGEPFRRSDSNVSGSGKLSPSKKGASKSPSKKKSDKNETAEERQKQQQHATQATGGFQWSPDQEVQRERYLNEMAAAEYLHATLASSVTSPSQRHGAAAAETVHAQYVPHHVQSVSQSREEKLSSNKSDPQRPVINSLSPLGQSRASEGAAPKASPPPPPAALRYQPPQQQQRSMYDPYAEDDEDEAPSVADTASTAAPAQPHSQLVTSSTGAPIATFEDSPRHRLKTAAAVNSGNDNLAPRQQQSPKQPVTNVNVKHSSSPLRASPTVQTSADRRRPSPQEVDESEGRQQQAFNSTSANAASYKPPQLPQSAIDSSYISGSSIQLPAVVGNYELLMCCDSQRETISIPSVAETNNPSARLGSTKKNIAKRKTIVIRERYIGRSMMANRNANVSNAEEDQDEQFVFLTGTPLDVLKSDHILRLKTERDITVRRQLRKWFEAVNNAPSSTQAQLQQQTVLSMMSGGSSRVDKTHSSAFRAEVNVGQQQQQHPHIVGLLDTFVTTQGDLFSVDEYCTGGELYEAVESFGAAAAEEEALEETATGSNRVGKRHPSLRGTVPIDIAARLFTELLSAVHHCHCNGIAHRDIKLENILLDRGNSVKLGKFGLAVACEKDTSSLGSFYSFAGDNKQNGGGVAVDNSLDASTVTDVSSPSHAFGGNIKKKSHLLSSICCGSKHYAAPEVILLGVAAREREDLMRVINDKSVVMMKSQQNSVVVSAATPTTTTTKKRTTSDANGGNKRSPAPHQDSTFQISAITGADSFSSNTNNYDLKTAPPDSSHHMDASGISQFSFTAQYDPRAADIWSCGVVLYALLTGSLPFDGSSSGNGGRNSVPVSSVNSSNYNEKLKEEETELLFQIMFPTEHLQSMECVSAMLDSEPAATTAATPKNGNGQSPRASTANNHQLYPSEPAYPDAAELVLAMLQRDPAKRPSAASIFKSKFVIGYLNSVKGG